jgi:hypothetical protein
VFNGSYNTVVGTVQEYLRKEIIPIVPSSNSYLIMRT